MARRRNSGISLTGILLIGGILYFTGAGTWLWNQTKELDTACYGALQEMGVSMGTPVCDELSRLLAKMEGGASGMGTSLRGAVDKGKIRASADLQQFANGVFARMGGNASQLAGLTSSANRLRDMMSQQPIVLPAATDAQQRMQMALDQYVIGQHYLQGSSVTTALPWFNRSAQQPGGYGILSQLALGDMYRNGSYGVPKDSRSAQYYYQQAQQSLTSLQQTPAPEAQQLLKSLPADPATLNRQLDETVRRLR